MCVRVCPYFRVSCSVLFLVFLLVRLCLARLRAPCSHSLLAHTIRHGHVILLTAVLTPSLPAYLLTPSLSACQRCLNRGCVNLSRRGVDILILQLQTQFINSSREQCEYPCFPQAKLSIAVAEFYAQGGETDATWPCQSERHTKPNQNRQLGVHNSVQAGPHDVVAVAVKASQPC